ncbi:hypothetical protein D3C71_1823110 [compost metagenome]
MTGMLVVAGWRLSSLSTWKPSIPGIMMSRMIRSGQALRAKAIPCSLCLASSTSYSEVKVFESTISDCGSSSMARSV